CRGDVGWYFDVW
nr:immunoglobulin heavy chain junction region [Mus musculus]